MNKTWLIIKREFVTRARKKSFIAMTLLGPFLLAAIIIVPLWLEKLDSQQVKHVGIIDDSQIFATTMQNKGNVQFSNLEGVNIDQAEKIFAESGYYAVLFIPKNVVNSRKTILYSDHPADFGLEVLIAKQLEKDIERLKLVKSRVPENLLASVDSPINVVSAKWNEAEGAAQVSRQTKQQIGIIATMIIYIFIFIYSSQVMRGIVEEKTNRIVEIIISSVRPVQLMMGKIIGIGALGLMQFVVWMVLSFTVVAVAQVTLFPEREMPTMQNPTASLADSQAVKTAMAVDAQGVDYALNLFDSVRNVNWTVMLGSFMLYFIFGFLLYSSIFAALGALVDNQTETGQFMVPVTIPLFISLMMMQVVVNNPSGPVAFWLSIIPFTSPISMMARIPFGVPFWEVALSLGLLIATFYITVLGGAKVYRTAILLHGKKISFGEVLRWLRNK